MNKKKIDTYYTEVSNEIKRGKFEKALKKLEDFIGELPENPLDIQLLSLWARYNVLKQKSNLGILEDEKERDKLIYNLIELLKEAEEIADDAPKLITSTEEWMKTESSDEIYGDPNHFVVLFKVVSDNLKKSTKAMQLKNGCIIQVTTERRSPDGVWSVAEAVSFVPDSKIVKDNPNNYKESNRKVGHHLEYNSDRK